MVPIERTDSVEGRNVVELAFDAPQEPIEHAEVMAPVNIRTTEESKLIDTYSVG